MEQLGHTDPKLALRLYTRAIRRPERVAGMKLVGVLNGVEWAPTGTRAVSADDAAIYAPAPEDEKTPR